MSLVSYSSSSSMGSLCEPKTLKLSVSEPSIAIESSGIHEPRVMKPSTSSLSVSSAAVRARGGHSQTNVLPTRVRTPQKWTLNGVLRHIKFAPLNGVTPVKHNLNGVIMGVTYPKWRTLLWYTVQYPKWRTLLLYTLQYPKWRTVYMVHSTIP